MTRLEAGSSVIPQMGLSEWIRDPSKKVSLSLSANSSDCSTEVCKCMCSIAARFATGRALLVLLEKLPNAFGRYFSLGGCGYSLWCLRPGLYHILGP